MQKKTKRSSRYNKVILIPTDFSEVCDNAVHHGIELAHFLKYRVCILHVITRPKDPVQENSKTDPEKVLKQINNCATPDQRKYNVQIDVMIKEGNILKVINKAATEIKANLMVLGTHGKQGLQHLFGSNALKVVLDSPCPVVVVQKRSFKKGYRRIVLPVSCDIEPRQSVDWVLLMNRLFGSEIMMFQSLETDETSTSRMKVIVRQITAILDEKKIPYQIHSAVTPGDFSSQIISHAAEHQSDMIMIMTMPREEVPGFNFADWNEQLMFNEAQIPVMCVNPVELGDSYFEWMM